MNDGSSMSQSGMSNDTIHNSAENISSQDCCTVKVIDSKVKDNYIGITSEKVDHFQFITIIEVKNISNNILSSTRINKIYYDTSPPLTSNSLYLNNSVLLI